jgi:hypothetical protein
MLKRIFQSVFGTPVQQPASTVGMVEQEDYDLLRLELQSKEKEIEELHSLCKLLGDKQPEIHYIDREIEKFTMTPAMFKKFKSQLENPVCSATTSQVQANYFLGMCRVLNHLEAEHVTSR